MKRDSMRGQKRTPEEIDEYMGYGDGINLDIDKKYVPIKKRGE